MPREAKFRTVGHEWWNQSAATLPSEWHDERPVRLDVRPLFLDVGLGYRHPPRVIRPGKFRSGGDDKLLAAEQRRGLKGSKYCAGG